MKKHFQALYKFLDLKNVRELFKRERKNLTVKSINKNAKFQLISYKAIRIFSDFSFKRLLSQKS